MREVIASEKSYCEGSPNTINCQRVDRCLGRDASRMYECVVVFLYDYDFIIV